MRRERRRGRRVWAVTALLCLAAGPAAAAEPAGAGTCSGCHAPAANAGAIPSLDGLTAAEIAGAMAAFRSGARPATVMDRISKGFSDDETAAIAAWLAGPADAATAEP
jgi:sulfide dehydrogenase cytochrome subunit